MIFDYKDILNLDNDSYEAWKSHLTTLENLALTQVRLLNGSLAITTDNDTIKSYCLEYVFMAEYGADLSAKMYEFHTKNMATLEEALRYAG